MKIQCILHADFEQAGHYAIWAAHRQIQVTQTHVFLGEGLPDITAFDMLLVMGGPQSPQETEQYPYLKDEIALIKQAVDAGKYVVGVCLGAQLIAESYGAATARSPHREIGVFPLTLTPEGKAHRLFSHFPETFDSAHWHNDMPGLPENAVVLAESAGCPRQIIQFAPKVFGFQCHLEFNTSSVAALIDNCPKDLKPNTYVQTKEAISTYNYSVMNQHLSQFLDKLVAN